MALKKYTDECLKDDNWIVTVIVNEKTNQIMKWGIQTHTAFEWLTYTTEELGELAEAISLHEYYGGRAIDVVKEAIQVATLALTIAEMYSENPNLVTS